MEPKSDAQEKDLACRLAYEFILESVKEDQEFENLEFVNKELPHKTILKKPKNTKSVQSSKKLNIIDY